MVTARELLDQADALMRRNRLRRKPELPVLTDIVDGAGPQVPGVVPLPDHAAAVAGNAVAENTTLMSADALPVTENSLPVTEHELRVSGHELPVSEHELPVLEHEMEVPEHAMAVPEHAVPVSNAVPLLANTELVPDDAMPAPEKAPPVPHAVAGSAVAAPGAATLLAAPPRAAEDEPGAGPAHLQHASAPMPDVASLPPLFDAGEELPVLEDVVDESVLGAYAVPESLSLPAPSRDPAVDEEILDEEILHEQAWLEENLRAELREASAGDRAAGSSGQADAPGRGWSPPDLAGGAASARSVGTGDFAGAAQTSSADLGALGASVAGDLAPDVDASWEAQWATGAAPRLPVAGSREAPAAASIAAQEAGAVPGAQALEALSAALVEEPPLARLQAAAGGTDQDDNLRIAAAVDGLGWDEAAAVASTPASSAEGLPESLAPTPAIPISASPLPTDAARMEEEQRWRALAEQVSMQVLQRIDLFTDTGLKSQLATHLRPIVDRASVELVAAINDQVGELLRRYVAEAIEREIAHWRDSQR